MSVQPDKMERMTGGAAEPMRLMRVAKAGVATVGRSIRLRLASSSFGRKVVLTAATNVILALVGLATGTLTARLLGPAGRGELAAIQTWPTTVMALSVLGLEGSLVYYSARFRDQAGTLFLTATSLALAVALPSIAAAFLAMPWLLGAQSERVVQLARVYLVIVILNATVGMLPHAVRGLSATTRWNLMRLQPSFFWLLVVVGAAWLGIASPTVLALGYLVSFALLVIPFVLLAGPLLRPPFKVRLELWPALLGFGLPTVLSSVPATLNFRLDQMLMAGLFEPSILGFYAVGVVWSNAFAPVVSAVAGVLTPHVSASHASPSAQLEQVAAATRLATGITLVCVGPLVALTPFALPALFGTAFAPAIVPSMVLVAAAGVAGINGVLEAGVSGLGRPAWSLGAEGTGLLVTGLGLLLLLQPYQMMGAALTSLASYSTTLLVLLWQLGRATPLRPASVLVPTQRDLATLMAYVHAARRIWRRGGGCS